MWRWAADAFRGKSTQSKAAEYVELDDFEEKQLKTKAKAKNSTLDDRILYCNFMLNKQSEPEKIKKYTKLLKELHQAKAAQAKAAQATAAGEAKTAQATAAGEAKAAQATAAENLSDDDDAVGSSNGSQGSVDSNIFESEGGKKSRHSKIKHRHSRKKKYKSKSKSKSYNANSRRKKSKSKY